MERVIVNEVLYTHCTQILCMLSRLGSKLRLWEQQIWQKIWGPINSTFQTFFSDKATQSQGLQVYYPASRCTRAPFGLEGKYICYTFMGFGAKPQLPEKFQAYNDDVSLLLRCTESHITLTLHQKICAGQKKIAFPQWPDTRGDRRTAQPDHNMGGTFFLPVVYGLNHGRPHSADLVQSPGPLTLTLGELCLPPITKKNLSIIIIIIVGLTSVSPC